MKTLTTLFLLTLFSCNGGGTSSAPETAQESVSCDSPFDVWVDNGGESIDLTGLDFELQAITKRAGDFGLSVSPDTECDIQVVAVGDNCSGEIHVITSEVSNPDPMSITTACEDIEKTYKYKNSSDSFLFGLKGSRPIGYH